MMCNSCYLVNPHYIRSIKGHTVTVGPDELTISQPKKRPLCYSSTSGFPEEVREAMIGFQFYAAGTFQFLIILVQGSILFAKGANRSEHFARRLTLDLLGLFLISLPLTLGYWRIDQAAGSAVLSNLAIVVLYLTLYLLTAAMLKRCFQLSCRSCLMAAATGYVCQHIFTRSV